MKNHLLTLALRVYSLVVTAFLLASLLLFLTDVIGIDFLPHVIATVTLGVIVRYAAVHHPFSKRWYRYPVTVVATVAFVVTATYTILLIVQAVQINHLAPVYVTRGLEVYDVVAAQNWVLLIFVLPAAMMVTGSIYGNDPVRYPRPPYGEAIAVSPGYLGVAYGLFGLWSVLFTLIDFHRILIFAPLFEELLKFGVAVLIGCGLYGRSAVGRIGAGLLIGLLFGVIEHATTYPTEPDTMYLFRALFHMTTAGLSVSAYTVFESLDETGLQWIAPAYPVMIHFFNNSFALIVTVLGILGILTQWQTATTVYSFAGVCLLSVLLLISVLSDRILVAIHRPLEQVLSTIA
jgi:hypothetical protein